jgi:SAM-dependent methyltransferase
MKSGARFLDWKDRSEKLKKQINDAWLKLHDIKWTMNGSDTYQLCGIDEHRLIKSLIKKYPHSKDFYVLDIGAGNFQFAHALAASLKADPSIPMDVKIHIISIRGEPHLQSNPIIVGNCILYNLGQFKIENLLDELNRLHFNVEGKIDLIVSRYCFNHLVDPLGTFIQAYNLLRPNEGLFLLTGFFHSRKSHKQVEYHFEYDKNEGKGKIIEGSTSASNEYKASLYLLLRDLNIPFLIQPDVDQNPLEHMILQKTQQSCQIPLRYRGYEVYYKPINWNASRTVTLLVEQREMLIPEINWYPGRLCGDQGLYSLLCSYSAIASDKIYNGPFIRSTPLLLLSGGLKLQAQPSIEEAKKEKVYKAKL